MLLELGILHSTRQQVIENNRDIFTKDIFFIHYNVHKFEFFLICYLTLHVSYLSSVHCLQL